MLLRILKNPELPHPRHIDVTLHWRARGSMSVWNCCSVQNRRPNVKAELETRLIHLPASARGYTQKSKQPFSPKLPAKLNAGEWPLQLATDYWSHIHIMSQKEEEEEEEEHRLLLPQLKPIYTHQLIGKKFNSHRVKKLYDRQILQLSVKNTADNGCCWVPMNITHHLWFYY